MVNIVMGATQKPLACEELKKFFTEHDNLDGYLYIGYPPPYGCPAAAPRPSE